MILICRGVKGYNDCTCCCSCCLSDLLPKQTTVNDPVTVAVNQVEPEVQPEVAKNGTEATEYGDIEGIKLEYFQKGLSSFTFDSDDLQRLTSHEIYHKVFKTFH